MRRFVVFYLLALLLYPFAVVCAQDDAKLFEDITNHWEIGVTAGANAFFGDLGGNKGVGKPFIKDFNSVTTRALLGVSADYFDYNWLCVRFSFDYTTVDGADSLIKADGSLARWRRYRNLSFRSRIEEAAVSGEVFPLSISDDYDFVRVVNPYIGLGIGGFHFNPETMFQGQWVYLRPLRTEGEGFAEYPKRKMYALYQVYIPLTVGIKIYLDNTFALSAGVTFRHTFTDYIDDVHSTYINPALFEKYASKPGKPGLLTPEQAYLAEQLYSRSLAPWKVKPGVARGDSHDNDSYTDVFLTLSIRLNKPPRFLYGYGG